MPSLTDKLEKLELEVGIRIQEMELQEINEQYKSANIDNYGNYGLRNKNIGLELNLQKIREHKKGLESEIQSKDADISSLENRVDAAKKELSERENKSAMYKSELEELRNRARNRYVPINPRLKNKIRTYKFLSLVLTTALGVYIPFDIFNPSVPGLISAYDKNEEAKSKHNATEEYKKARMNRGLEYNNLGIDQYKKKNFDSAAQYFRRAIAVNPHDGIAHNNLAVILGMQNKFDLAIDEYKKSIEINPNDAVAHNNLGIKYFDQGKFDLAVQELNKSIQINPSYPDPYVNLGVVYEGRGNMKLADEFFEKATQIVERRNISDKNIESEVK